MTNNLPRRLTTRLTRLTTRLRRTDPTTRPLPHITADTGPTLPGWTLRAALLALTPLLLLTAASRTDLPDALIWTVTTLCTTLLVLHPTPTTTGTTVVTSALLLWGFEPPTAHPLDTTNLLTALATALLAYLLTRTTWWAAHLPPTGRLETTALLNHWRRDLTVLTTTGLLGLLAHLASRTTLPGAVLIAALAVAGTVFVALANGRARRDDGRD